MLVKCKDRVNDTRVLSNIHIAVDSIRRVYIAANLNAGDSEICSVCAELNTTNLHKEILCQGTKEECDSYIKELLSHVGVFVHEEKCCAKTFEDGCYKGFDIPLEAWYGSVEAITEKRPHMMIGIYSESGGTKGEFELLWEKSGIRLCVFSDGIRVLKEMPEVLELLQGMDESGIQLSVDQVADRLVSVGYRNCTAYTRECMEKECDEDA